MEINDSLFVDTKIFEYFIDNHYGCRIDEFFDGEPVVYNYFLHPRKNIASAIIQISTFDGCYSWDVPLRAWVLSIDSGNMNDEEFDEYFMSDEMAKICNIYSLLNDYSQRNVGSRIAFLRNHIDKIYDGRVIERFFCEKNPDGYDVEFVFEFVTNEGLNYVIDFKNEKETALYKTVKRPENLIMSTVNLHEIVQYLDKERKNEELD